MGLSFGENPPEADLDYHNVVDELYLQKFTQSRAFSIALGSSDSDDDSVIIFGGIDTSKFVGHLDSLPILEPQNGENVYRCALCIIDLMDRQCKLIWNNRYWLQLNSIGTTSSSSSRTYENSSLPVVLDTGSTFCALPDSIIKNMMDDLSGHTDEDGDVIVDCSHVSDNATFDFDFGNITINVPYSEIVLQVSDQICVLGVSSASHNISVLGDSFLRSAYLVFDQKNMEVSIAPYANCGQTESTISDDGVSGVEGKCTNTSTNGDEDENDGPRIATDILGLLAACMSVVIFLEML